MIQLMPESHDSLLVFKASEKLTADDYKKRFIPELQKCIDKYERIDLVMEFDEAFKGFEAGAMWEDAKFGTKHRHNFHKIAVVGIPKSVGWMTKVGKHLVDFEIKNFERGHVDDAETWVTLH